MEQMSLAHAAYEKFRSEGLYVLFQSSKQYLRDKMKSIYLSATNQTVECHGVELNLNNREIDIRTKQDFFKELFEKPELVLIDKYPPEADVIELGAGLGFISCYLNNRLAPSAKHVAVEANPKLIPTLRENKQINNCSFNIKHAAYAASGKTASFHLQDQYPSGSVRAERESGSSVQIEGTTLRTLADEENIETFTLVADIEGEEIGLIQKELRYLEQHCRRIIVEFHSFVPKEEYTEALNLLDSSSFESEESNSKLNDGYDDYRVYTNSSLVD